MTLKIAVLSASWNKDIVQAAEDSFKNEISKLSPDSQVDVIKVVLCKMNIRRMAVWSFVFRIFVFYGGNNG